MNQPHSYIYKATPQARASVPLSAALRRLLPALAFALAPAALAAPTGRLNDTGQTSCYNAGNTAVACSASVGGDSGSTNPRQDARFGRDPKAVVAGSLTKTGGGAAGFDFTKICMSGTAAGQGACPANPTANTGASPAANDWACTKDNVTNLIWSLQSISGSTWTDATVTLPPVANSANRCGFNSGWRAPTRRELLSIVYHRASSPAIDSSYFPVTTSNYYWSSDAYALNPAADAWYVDFSNGYTYAGAKTNAGNVRLVRSGQ